ncbi:hypothetical protein Tco_0487129 [Tanacetum coccineum]
MTDMNIPANDAPAEQAPVVAPPTRIDDQIFPLSKWLDEQWFNLHKDILRDALAITPTNNDNPFVAPPSSDTVIEYVNTLGYPNILRNILWGIIHRSNIDYAERIWEEFLQSIQTFLTGRKNLATASRGKKKIAHLLIPNVRFSKLIIHYLKTKHNIHPRTDSALHYSHEESVLNTLSGYLEHVAEYQRYLDEEQDKAEEEEVATKSPKATKVTKPKAAKVTKPDGDKATKPTSTQTPKPKPTPTQPSKSVSEKKQKLVKETPNEPSPAKRSKGGLVGKRRKPKSPLKLVDEPSDEGVPVEYLAHTNEEADLQRALELKVQGKEKEKVIDEQSAHDLLTLQTPMKKSPAD